MKSSNFLIKSILSMFCYSGSKPPAPVSPGATPVPPGATIAPQGATTVPPGSATVLPESTAVPSGGGTTNPIGQPSSAGQPSGGATQGERT